MPRPPPFAAIAWTLVAAGILVTALVLVGLWQDARGPAEAAAVSAAPPFETALTERLAFADASGDATDTGTGALAEQVGCWVGGAVTGRCLEAARDVRAGTPGPHLDVLEVALEAETATELVVSLSVARLSEGFPELRTPDALHRMTWYAVCWATAPEDRCSRWVALDVMHHDGEAHLDARFSAYTPECNEWRWCTFTIPVEVEHGAPAKITFRVPKAYAAFDGAPLAMDRLTAYTGWYQEATAFPMWHPGVTAHTPAYHFHTHGGGVGTWSQSDMTETFPVGLAFAPHAALPPHPLDAPILPGAAGANHGAGSPYDKPELDILWFDLHEDAGDLVAVFALREWHGTPEYDFDHSVAVGIEGNVWEIGYRHEGGRVYGYAGRCIMEPCQDGPVMDPVVEIQEGSPAFLSVRVPLSFLGEPEPGTATSLLWAMSMYSDVNLYWGHHGDDVYGDYHSVFMIDALFGGAPYVFGSGHRAPYEAEVGGHAH